MIHDLVVKLVSPLILGGAKGGKCDSPLTLRPPSLRGQLRFWSRALGGEGLQDRLWGTTQTGQRVRILGTHPLGRTGEACLFPHKPEALGVTEMVPPGERVHMRFALPSAELLPELQAVVWTWLHLGTIGRRSRRGYGAFTWETRPGDLLDGFLDDGFNPKVAFAGPSELASYLERGLRAAFSTLSIVAGDHRASRAIDDDFRLASLDQVFIGRHLTEFPLGPGLKRHDHENFHYRWNVRTGGQARSDTDSRTALESLLHGLNWKYRGAAPENLQLGKSSSKPASPMMWRLYPCTQGGHLPIMVWSPVSFANDRYPQLQLDHAEDLCQYLEDDLGFSESIAGNHLTEKPRE